MDLRPGDRVLVNLAPFIGSVLPSKESIPCVVLEVGHTHVRVRTLPPYREVSLQVLSCWVDGRVKEKRDELLSARV